jgi:LysM repeat protein
MGLEKLQITIEHTGQVVRAMFNPEEYSLSKDNNYASQAIPGLSGPILQFVAGNQRTLDMELFFDTTADRTDVRSFTSKVTDLLKIDAELHAPPVLLVSWGSLSLRCVLGRVSQKFLQFLEDGRPVRARLTVTFNEFLDPEREAKEVNRQTADFTKVHVTGRGETLEGIAARYYQNPFAWRAIALANDIDDPFNLEPGFELQIPSLPFRDPETGEVAA